MFVGTITLSTDWQFDTVFVIVTLYVPATLAVVVGVFVAPVIPGPVQA